MSAPSVRRTSPCARAGCDRPRTARPIGADRVRPFTPSAYGGQGRLTRPIIGWAAKSGDKARGKRRRGHGGRSQGAGRTGRTAVQGRGAGAGRTARREGRSGRLCGLTAVNFPKALYLQHARPGVLLHRHPDFQKLDTCQPAQPRIPRTAARFVRTAAPRTRVAPPTPRAPRTERARRPHHGRRRALDLLSRKPRGSHMHGTHPRGPRRADYFAASSRPTRYGKVVQQAPRFWPWNAKL